MASVMSEYVASIGFALNFEDHKVSAQVRAGESVLFDGKRAQYTNRNGEDIAGVAPSLRTAINMKWLNLKTNGGVSSEEVQQAQQSVNRDGDRIPGNPGEKYDNLKGGSFDEAMAKERRTGAEVIREDDLIVKETGPIAVEEKKAAAASEKLEVAGDQVQVKENVMVNSSTMNAPTKTHNTEIRRSEDYGADATKPLKKAEEKQPQETKKRETFTVDDTTPRVSEDATLKEVKRAVIQNEGESQDARVVKKIKIASMNVESPEGVTLKKEDEKVETKTETKVVEGVTFKTEEKVAKTEETGATVSSGGEAITEIGPGTEGVEIVQKREGVNIALQEAKEEPQTDEDPDYLSMLPEDWGSLHWTKKEKFIKIITNVDFLKFILSVETTTAVQNACKARLEELGQKVPD